MIPIYDKSVLKKLDEKIPLSNHFTWGEALWMEKSGAYALPTIEQVNNICNTAQALDKVRDYYNRALIIRSWLRTPAHNSLIGGALKSTHMEGLAIDFVVSGLDVHKVREELNKRPDIWPYRIEQGTPTWIHGDLRPGHRLFYP